jgi:hypothetical protein
VSKDVLHLPMTTAQVAQLERLMKKFEPLLNDPPALLEEMRRQGRKKHVRADAELSLLLGMLLGSYTRALEGRPYQEKPGERTPEVVNREYDEAWQRYQTLMVARQLHATGAAHECDEWRAPDGQCDICGSRR